MNARLGSSRVGCSLATARSPGRPYSCRSSCSVPTARSAMARLRALLDQAVELRGILAGDLAHDVGGQVAELLLDVLARLRPDAVGVRIVRRPHERLHAHLVDELGADAIELERRLALSPPVIAGLHREPEVAEAVLPLEVHAVERVGNPADAALAERDPQIG